MSLLYAQVKYVNILWGMYVVWVLLLQTAAPKHWIAYDGNVTQMDTPDTIRAQQLRDIYQSINRDELNPTERLDVLLTLKQTVKV